MARPASDIAERIVRAARDRFLVEGVEGASLRAIARDAGTNLGMVYYYYPNKDDLFLAVVEEVYGRIIEDIGRAVSDAGPDTRVKIERLYARLAAMSDDEMIVLRLILREAIAAQSTRIGLLFERFSRGHIVMLGAMLQGGIQRGEVRPDMPPFVLIMCTLFLGLFPQLVRRRLGEAQVPVDLLFPSPADLSGTLANLLLQGIEPRVPLAPSAAEPQKSTAPAEKKPEPVASKARAASPTLAERKAKAAAPRRSRK